MKKPLSNVTDHAVLRYLERVKGMDVEAVRREIGHLVDRHLEYPGASGIVVGGYSYRLTDAGTVATVIKAHRPDKRFRARRSRGFK